MKRLKNIEAKNKEQLTAIEDQGEKQLQVVTEKQKKVDFKNISFKNSLNPESIRVYNEIKEQNKKIDYTKLTFNGSCKHYHKSTIFLSLRSFAESIYNASLGLKLQKLNKKILKICS